MENEEFYKLQDSYDGLGRRVQQVSFVGLVGGLATLFGFSFFNEAGLEDLGGSWPLEKIVQTVVFGSGIAYAVSLLYRWGLLTAMNDHPYPGDAAAFRRLFTGFYTRHET